MSRRPPTPAELDAALQTMARKARVQELTRLIVIERAAIALLTVLDTGSWSEVERARDELQAAIDAGPLGVGLLDAGPSGDAGPLPRPASPRTET